MENYEYQQIYNLGRKIVNNQFKDVTCPMMLLPEHVKWLVRARDEKDRLDCIDELKKNYPDGVSIVTLDNKVKFEFDNRDNKLLKSSVDYIDKRILASAGIVDATPDYYFKKHFRRIWLYCNDEQKCRCSFMCRQI